jgi:putative NADH-flavin reductase
MRVSLIGATGNAGSRILAELAQRGHQITAIVRHPERVPQLDGVTAKECDANRVDDLAPVLRGHDVVVSSVHFLDGQADKLIDAVRQARVPGRSWISYEDYAIAAKTSEPDAKTVTGNFFVDDEVLAAHGVIDLARHI